MVLQTNEHKYLNVNNDQKIIVNNAFISKDGHYRQETTMTKSEY